jgi:hypothetical protein
LAPFGELHFDNRTRSENAGIVNHKIESTEVSRCQINCPLDSCLVSDVSSNTSDHSFDAEPTAGGANLTSIPVEHGDARTPVTQGKCNTEPETSRSTGHQDANAL